METIKLEKLDIGYADKVVQKNLNATFESGKLVCLLGRNGIGKSTLLRTLAMFQPALSGEVLLEGKPLTDYSIHLLSRKLSIVLTRKPDVQNITVTEMVGLGRSPYTGFWGGLTDEDHTIVRESIQLVGIEPLAGRMVHTLSDGERQKVMIAKALAQQTPIIYLDEPTAFLDYPSKVETMQLLRRLAIEQQKTIFLSTHDVELSLQVADCLWLMEPGGLNVGTPRELAALGALSRFIERPGITFDIASLQIKVHSE